MRQILHRCLLPLALVALLLLAGAARAQSPAAPAETGSTQRFTFAEAPEQPPLSAAELEGLIATLEDPEQRERLIGVLRTLQTAAGEAPAGEPPLAEDLVASLIAAGLERAATVREVSHSVIDSLALVPAFVDWLEHEASDAQRRAHWLSIGLRVALYLGIAGLAFVVTALALRPARRRLGHEAEAEAGVPERVFRLLVILLLDLLPIVAFGLGVTVATLLATLSPLSISAETRIFAQPVIQAVVLGRVSAACARLLFAPDAAALRLLPLSDAAARRSFTWTRLIALTAIYGYYALEAWRHLGLPWTVHGFLLHLLFLVVALMTTLLIVRQRAPVAHALGSLAENAHSGLVRRLPWRGLASVWHLLAAFYVLLVFMVWALKIPGGFRLLFGATVGTVLILIGCWLALRLIDHLFSRSPAMPDGDDTGSVVDRRIRGYLPVAGSVARVLVWLGAAIGLLEVWGFGTIHWLRTEAGQNLLGHLAIVFAIALFTVVVWEAISLAIERSISEQDDEGNLRYSNRTRTLLNIMRNFLAVFLSVIALFLILSELGLNIAPLLAGAGVVGLAIGFGSQKLVQDIITGLFVLLGDTMRIGDVVELAGRVGVVEQMTMRTVVLREYGGNVHTIPYSAIDTVTNYTKDFSYAVFDIGVAYRENVDHVMEVLREIGAEMNHDSYFRRLILEPLEIAGVDAFADSAVIIKARFKTRPLKQWEVRREFARRVKNRFDELGIEIPFPHQTIYFGVDKQGQAPPVRVDLGHEPAATGAAPEVRQDAPAPAAVLARSRGG